MSKTCLVRRLKTPGSPTGSGSPGEGEEAVEAPGRALQLELCQLLHRPPPPLGKPGATSDTVFPRCQVAVSTRFSIQSSAIVFSGSEGQQGPKQHQKWGK